MEGWQHPHPCGMCRDPALGWRVKPSGAAFPLGGASHPWDLNSRESWLLVQGSTSRSIHPLGLSRYRQHFIYRPLTRPCPTPLLLDLGRSPI